MKVICLMLSWSALSHPVCHVERSAATKCEAMRPGFQTSLDATRHTAAANDLRFFSRDCGIRMTATCACRCVNP